MVKHPAKYTDSILDVFKEYIKPGYKILDPMSGTGKLKNIYPDAFLNEIEYEWSIQGKPANAVNGNALCLPFADKCFDGIFVSPTYSNRMADHHLAKDSSKRNTYTHVLGRQLHEDNSGKMQWGNEYIEFHRKAWKESLRVLKSCGIMLLNISNHIRKGKEVNVVDCHFNILTDELRMMPVEQRKVVTPRLRYGANSNKRCKEEYVLVFRKE